MTLLAKHSVIKEDKSNIITLGALAQKAKENDSSVINATIGMLFSEEEKLLVFDSVNKAALKLSDMDKYSYASTPGSKEFHEALKDWVFREYKDEILSKMFCECMATPGGSGAISNTFTNYLNLGDKVLLPNYMWGNYKQFAYENFEDYITYNLFNENGSLDLNDIYNKMVFLKESQGRVLLVINDPCQNPTGYCMKHSEWMELINMINELSSDGTPFILLHDMAYIDYDGRGMNYTRQTFRMFEEFNSNVLVILAFSGSKTLALYGFRVGAQIAISKEEANVLDFAKANKFSSRAKWSNTSHIGMSIITKIMQDPLLKKSFEDELEAARNMLNERAKIFLDNAKSVGLVTLPFECGFFVTIPCENANLVYERLVARKIHVIPMGNVLRVTISAICKASCALLPKEIKECMEK